MSKIGAETVTKQYTIGKGQLFFRLEGDAGYLRLGNTPNFSVNVDLEELLHFSSEFGINKQDDSAVIQQDINGTYSLDEMEDENLKLFFMASAIQNQDQAALAGQSLNIMDAQRNRVYKINAYNLTNVVVTSLADSTTYTLNTDYEIDVTSGVIFIAKASAINGDDITIDYDQANTAWTEIYAATSLTVKGHLFFKGDPPKGVRLHIEGYVSLKPGGEAGQVSDEWMTLPFEFKYEEHADYTGLFDLKNFGVVTSTV